MIVRLLVFLVVAVSFGVTSAQAAEPKAVATEIAAARKSKDDAATGVAVKKAPDAYRGSEDKSGKSALLGELGKVIKDKKMKESSLAAVAALVEINDGKACWKQMSRMLPHPKKTEEASDIQLAVVAAAGKLVPKSAIKALIELGYKAKDNKAAAAAVLALGGYGKDKKNRVKILEEIMGIALRTRPGQTTTKAPSAEAIARWGAVGPACVGALNRLTSTTHQTFEEWESLYKDNKKRPGDLFPEDDD